MTSAADLQARAQELREHLSSAQAQLALAEDAFAEDAGSFDKMAQAQARVTSLESAQRLVEDRLQAARSREAAETEVKRRAALRGTATLAAAEAAEHYADFSGDLLDEAAAAIEPIFAKMHKKLVLHAQARGRFVEAAQVLAPALRKNGWAGAGHISSPAAQLAQQDADDLLRSMTAGGTDLSAVLTPVFAFLPETSRDHPAPTLPSRTRLHHGLWLLFLRWYSTQAGTQPMRLYVSEPPRG